MTPSHPFTSLLLAAVLPQAPIDDDRGRTQQHVGTFSYELTPTRSIGGRIVTQDADTNWYCSFRHSGIFGTETYLILGDPNARRFVSQGMMKMVFAL